MSVIKQLYHIVVPAGIRLKMYNRRARIKNENIKNDIITYYANNPTTDSEINDALDFLKDNPISVLPYKFHLDYLRKNIEVLFDENNNFPYVLHGKNKLYFKRSWSVDKIISCYQMLLAEQDKNSPHYYFSDDFNIEQGSVVVDVGAAEGIFALHDIENISHLYMIETDPEWVEVLKLTYKNWAHKITIIEKYVSNIDDKNNLKLDSYFKDFDKIDFLKIDVDGAEQELIYGANETLSSKTRKLVICTYHKQNDNHDFSIYLKAKDFKITNSDKYMLYYYVGEFEAPYFRRGVIRAEKEY